MTTAPAEKLAPIAVRRMKRPDDDAFVFRAWLKACRTCHLHQHLPARVYYDDQHDLVERLLRDDAVDVLMAAAPEDHSELYGWLCTGRLDGATVVVHFAYTKKHLRGWGVFRQLAAAAGLDLGKPFYYTHHAGAASKLCRRFPRAVYRREILGLGSR